jgi:hypothetical protein
MEILMPLQATSGAASYDAFGGGVAAVPNYIEECFSTTLYTGNGSTQTITNGIDLAGKGGLVWIKDRSNGTRWHILTDTVRGAGKHLSSNSTFGETAQAGQLSAFTSSGFSVGNETDVNASGSTYASWTFREQPKFFDVVTYTGNGTSQNIAHNLGSVPGFIVYKRTNGAANWCALARKSNGTYETLYLNTTGATLFTAASAAAAGLTATTFDPSTIFGGEANDPGDTYVAYLFAHDAGGFGLTGTDNVISCGSYSGSGAAGNAINLGYEPQWVMTKRVDSTGDWNMQDVMRGMPVGSNMFYLRANTSGAEADVGSPMILPNATGFSFNSGSPGWNGSGADYIYIAIRRGPMKVPTTGTSVFSANATSAATGTAITTSFPIDLQVWSARASSLALNRSFIDRLRGAGTLTTDSNSPYLLSPSTAAEATDYGNTRAWSNTGFSIADVFGGINSIYWNFRRAPGFFDEVCYTGTGSTTTFAHNLGVKPELIIFKARISSSVGNWPTHYYLPDNTSIFGRLSTTDAFSANLLTATSTTFEPSTNSSGVTCVAYLFATCPGVSKVGSYTGNGSSQTINCGFTGGARFVLIKRTDSTGDWYVWDTARGIVSGNDPHLSLNTTAAEVTSNDTIDTDSTGFVVNQVSATNVNVSSATYIFLAIA